MCKYCLYVVFVYMYMYVCLAACVSVGCVVFCVFDVRVWMLGAIYGPMVVVVVWCVVVCALAGWQVAVVRPMPVGGEDRRSLSASLPPRAIHRYPTI